MRLERGSTRTGLPVIGQCRARGLYASERDTSGEGIAIVHTADRTGVAAIHTVLQAAVKAANDAHPELLQNTGFRAILLREGGSPDFDRFLSGAPLTQNELSDLAVPRRIWLAGRMRSPDDVVDWIGDRARTTLLLHGEAGEGKSTYVASLCRRLSGQYVLLRWKQGPQFDLQAAANFRDIVASYLDEKSLPLQVLIISELRSALSRDQEIALIGAMEDYDEDPAEYQGISVLIAGRPSWTGVIRRRIASSHARLVPLTPPELTLLGNLIANCYANLSAGQDAERLRDLHNDYPNIQRFVALDEKARSALLGSGEAPMIASMLTAVYGEDFHRRLTDEYAELSSEDRHAYLTVCLSAQCMSGISDRLLSILAPEADTGARSQLDPWSLGPDELHIPRHSVIGRTIVEEAAHILELRRAVGKLLDEAPRYNEAREILGNLLLEFARWNPVSAAPTGKSSAQLRSYARNEVAADPARWAAIEGALNPADPWELMHWAYILTRILPDHPNGGPTNTFLIESAMGLNEAAARSARETLPFGGVEHTILIERAAYYRVILRREADQIIRSEPSDDVADVKELARLIGKSWCRPDFYGQLVGICSAALKAPMGSARFDEYDSDNWLLLTTLVVAFQHLRAQAGVFPQIQLAYAEIVGRLMHGVVIHRKEELLRLGWAKASELNTPDPALAVLLDETLAAIRGDDRSKAHLLAERREILLTAAEGSQEYPEALLRLSFLVSDDDMLRSRARELIAPYLAFQAAGIFRGMVLHSKALLDDEHGAAQAAALSEAVAFYNDGIKTRDHWLNWKDYWKEAIRALSRVDKEAADRARVDYLDAQRRVGSSSRPARPRAARRRRR